MNLLLLRGNIGKPGTESLLLPVLVRAERDEQASGLQFVTAEDTVCRVNMSHGELKPVSPEVCSDVWVLCELGERIKRAAAEQLPVIHPTIPGALGVSQTLFAAPLRRGTDGLESHNAVVISPGRIDRSPTGIPWATSGST